MILGGKSLAREMQDRLRERVAALREHTGKVPILATILVGNDPASETYVRMKGNACRRIGMDSKRIVLPESATTEDLLRTVDELNRDPNVHGILLQHPVPNQIDERRCFDRIDIDKDVDGVTSGGFGLMSMGGRAFGSATPAGIIQLLDYYGIEIAGKHAVVVGRSPILGKPVAMMLLSRNATVTICHSRTLNLKEHILAADIVVGAVGKPEFIRSEWIKDGAVVVDAGYHPGGVGDIELEGVKGRCSAYTPVPGGVGPMTIATLIEQTVLAAESKVQQVV